MEFPSWVEHDDESLFLREVAPGLFIGARESPSYLPWGLVIDLHGIPRQTTRGHIVWRFHDGLPFPDLALSDIESHVHYTLFEDRREEPVLIACELGRSRSASCAYAMLRKLFGLSHDEAYARITTDTTFEAGPKSLTVSWPREKTLASARAWVEQVRYTDSAPEPPKKDCS